MLSDRLLQRLNDQMNWEFFTSHTYLSMASYCAAEGFNGFANFFEVQAAEERAHGMKIYKYINLRSRRAVVAGMKDPLKDFSSVREVFEKGYELEKEVTKRIYELSDLAADEREHATTRFLQWLVEEQLEEESLFAGIVHKLNLIDKNSTAYIMLDAELARRTYSPEG